MAKIHTGTIRFCPRCAATREGPFEFKGRYVPVEIANELEREIERLKVEIQKLRRNPKLEQDA